MRPVLVAVIATLALAFRPTRSPAAVCASISSAICRAPTELSSARVLERNVEGQKAVYLFRVEQVYKGDIENRIEVVIAGQQRRVRVGARGRPANRPAPDPRGRSVAVEPLLAGRSVGISCADERRDDTPPINWGGVVVGVLVLGAGGFFLVRKLRSYRALR